LVPNTLSNLRCRALFELFLYKLLQKTSQQSSSSNALLIFLDPMLFQFMYMTSVFIAAMFNVEHNSIVKPQQCFLQQCNNTHSINVVHTIFCAVTKCDYFKNVFVNRTIKRGITMCNSSMTFNTQHKGCSYSDGSNILFLCGTKSQSMLLSHTCLEICLSLP
jgi:hypothetical protein